MAKLFKIFERFNDGSFAEAEVHDDYATAAAGDILIKAAIPSGGSGRDAPTPLTITSAAATIARAGRDAMYDLTISGVGPISLADMQDGDVWVLNLLGDGLVTNYTPTFAQTLTDQDGEDLTQEVMNPTKEVEITVRKRGGNYWTIRKEWAEGAPASGPATPGDVRGSYLSGQTASTAVTAASLDVAPVSGDGILLIAVAPGPTTSATVNFTAPAGATQLADYAGDNYSSRIRIWHKTYASETDWTFGSDSSIGRVAVIALDGLTTFTAGAGAATLDAGAVANGANALGIYIGTAGWDAGDDSTWTGPPSGHSLVVDNRATVTSEPNTQVHIAAIDLATAGTYDPGPTTFGPSSQAFSSIPVVAVA